VSHSSPWGNQLLEWHCYSKSDDKEFWPRSVPMCIKNSSGRSIGNESGRKMSRLIVASVLHLRGE
jgi:hypothetical protein